MPRRRDKRRIDEVLPRVLPVRVSVRSASPMFCRAKGGGLRGKGWVGAARSPDTSDFGTGRSSPGTVVCRLCGRRETRSRLGDLRDGLKFVGRYD